MHIVYLVENIDKIGGIERSLTVRANYLIRTYEYEITIVCTEKDTGIPAYEIDSSIKILFLEPLTSKKSVFSRLFLRLQQANRIINTLNPDIVISVKYTLHNLFFRLLLNNKKFISEIREPKEQYNDGLSSSLKSFLYQKIRNYVLSKQDAMIVLTEVDKKNWGFSNIEVVANPHTITTTEVSKLLNKQVLAIGRLHKVKGFDKLLEAWKIVVSIHPNWKLKICGKGEEFENLSSHIKFLGIKKSVILPNKSLPVLPEFLDSSIFVLTSQFEAFGNVLVESKICGVPIVAFDAPNGPREIIVHGKDGYIVKLNDIKAMAEKIIFLINNPAIRIRMGSYAKEDSKRFDVNIIVEKYNNILMQVFEK